jgi:KUP system potassium uptake protein
MSVTSRQASIPAPSGGEKGDRASGWRLTLGAIGVVYGDIGTSPIYAFRESIGHVLEQGAAAQRAEIVGVVSLMLWSLTVVVLIKYVLILLRLDNRGEGGVLALMALVQQKLGRRTPLLFILGVTGAGLFFGDAVLTPAISVLSAVEGLTVLPGVGAQLAPFVLPLSLVILVGLFLVQKVGTGVVGGWFGPVCAVWFVAMALLGLLHLSEDWGVLAALNPLAAVGFLFDHGSLGFIVLGSVFLTVTGAEALYADLGHFGRRPISVAWMAFVFPMLTLNYLGQGAMVLAAPGTASQPFFLMAPDALRPALVILATLATIIASQAVISGAYSLTRQAIQLGLLPRLQIEQTSAARAGEIYMPQVNLLLMVGALAVAAGFGSSGELAGAYGVSVIGAMMTTTLLATLAIWRVFERPLWLALCLTGPILVVELVFLASNLLKLGDGGVVPILMGGAIVVVMWTWARGSALLVKRSRRNDSFPDVLHALDREPIKRVPGTAVFLTADPRTAPTAFLHNIKHNKVVHERVVVLSVVTAATPLAAPDERIVIEEIRPDAHLVVLTFGFMETPNVSRALQSIRPQGKPYDPMSTSYFLSRRTLIPTAKSGMPLWQDRLYILLAKNATSATDFFHIPSWRVVELGSQEFL